MNGYFLEVSVKCENLLNRSIGSLSDPFAVLFEFLPTGVMLERTRTEVVPDDLNPQFVTKLRFDEDDYKKSFRIIVKDNDPLRKDEHLGVVDFTPKKLLEMNRTKISLQLEEEPGAGGDTLSIIHLYLDKLRVESRTKKIGFDIGFESDCKVAVKKRVVLCVSRSAPDMHDFVLVYRSEPLTLPKRLGREPLVFPYFEVVASTLTAQDSKRSILIQIFLEGGRTGPNRSVGEVELKVERLLSASASFSDSVAFFSGYSRNSGNRPQLVLPKRNHSGTSSVVVLRISNLYLK